MGSGRTYASLRHPNSGFRLPDFYLLLSHLAAFLAVLPQGFADFGLEESDWIIFPSFLSFFLFSLPSLPERKSLSFADVWLLSPTCRNHQAARWVNELTDDPRSSPLLFLMTCCWPGGSNVGLGFRNSTKVMLGLETYFAFCNSAFVSA